MIGFVCIDGTGVSDDIQYTRDYKDSNVNWVYETGKCYGMSFYNRGPGYVGAEMPYLVEWGWDHVMQCVSQNDCQGIILAGHSRGLAALLEVAHRMNDKGMPIDYLAMFDGVDCTYQSYRTDWIPGNVRVARYAMRDPSTRSRPYWGNCGTKHSDNTDYKPHPFYCTHGGVGGAAWYPPPKGVGENEFIHELGEPDHTFVTYRSELIGYVMVRPWIEPSLMNTINRIENQQAKPPVSGQPVSGKPVTGQPVTGGPNNGGSSKIYVVVKGDSLSLIAGKFWGDVLLWPLIYDVNKQRIGKRWNVIQPTWQLSIPNIKSYSPSQLSDARTRGRNWH